MNRLSTTSAATCELPEFESYAVSDVARMVREGLMQVHEWLRESEHSWRWRDVRDQLLTVTKECLKEGWDGYGARPVPVEALLKANLALLHMPMSVRLPEVLAEPSGKLDLEWRDDVGSVFVLAFSGRNEVQYAGVSPDGAKYYGSEPFVAEIPGRVLAHLVRFQRAVE